MCFMGYLNNFIILEMEEITMIQIKMYTKMFYSFKYISVELDKICREWQRVQWVDPKKRRKTLLNGVSVMFS